ncbi:helix-turn-helix domain-containing protein [Nocardia sp. NBC_00565]|uniref:helix-turn-helix domain-containing protein n=1 Tax=Nocardia sp. NBC_00565 TaxID=2975993 RepID=UPI002E805468|nr:helix-turn-helix domain-containing protein [Nocardia sp. NBC_00565]WUC03438.1 helix-turn-helix domain-containing protein [Nocardia sp. NBC_00565]
MRGAISAPTARVVDVVELLARRGNVRLRYSDIARELDLTLATTHTILKTLCDRGWVTRDPAGKAYTLGPGLAVVAAAVNTRPFVEAARAAAVELAAEFGYAASVTEKVADSLVITAFEGGERAWPGDRIPYAPPFGAVFAAWDTAEERRTWIQRAAATSTAIAERLELTLARIRDRGFDVDYTSPAIGRAASLIGTLDTGTIALPSNIQETLDRLRVEFTTLGFPDATSSRPQPVAAITAPVLDAQGHVALLLSVHPLGEIPPEQIDTIGHHLVRTTTAITGAARSGARTEL